MNFLRPFNPLLQWAGLRAVGEPRFAEASNGRPPIGLERMLRIRFIH